MVTGMSAEDVRGTAYVYPDEVRIVLTGGVAQLGTTPNIRPTGLSAGLAFGDPNGKWSSRKMSRRILMSDIRHRGDTLTDTLEFRIPGTSGLNLAEHWVIIQQHAEGYVASIQQWTEITRPINSPLDVFRAR